jgi:tetratricopeptide (TPR) repeat protein
MGDVPGADNLYLQAEDELTAKEMRPYAWLELQRGMLDLTQGRYEEAGAHYARSRRAYSGHWQVDEQLAELLAAQGRFDDAVALYEDLVARVSKPELRQTLGELYEFMGKSDEAQPWYEEALASYLESAKRGDVHYYHHLTDFYADVREDGAEAVKWARKDLALRANFSTQAALAWALYRNGEFTEALDAMNQALSSGARDAEIFLEAGMIHRAVGMERAGREYFLAAAEINPKHMDFHAHR